MSLVGMQAEECLHNVLIKGIDKVLSRVVNVLDMVSHMSGNA